MLPKKYNKIESDQMKKMLGAILVKAKLGRSTEYNYCFKNRKTKNNKGFEHGRLFSTTPSLQGLQRILRNVIIDKDNCVDVDMINCHPCLLNQAAGLLNVTTPILNNYVNCRDSLLLELQTLYNLPRDEAKTIPLAIINGGIRSVMYPKITWLKEFEDEIKIIYSALMLTDIGKDIDLNDLKYKLCSSRNYCIVNINIWFFTFKKLCKSIWNGKELQLLEEFDIDLSDPYIININDNICLFQYSYNQTPSFYFVNINEKYN